MGSYLQTYGVEEARRGRVVKMIAGIVASLIVLGLVGYLTFHNYPEKSKAKQFLSALNAHDYRGAYAIWGCSDKSPCPNYDFGRFQQDWHPQSQTGEWKIESTDSCSTFLTLNVQAPGTELESIAVQRADKSLGFAPEPECQEPKWHFKQFFARLFGKSDTPPPPPSPSDGQR